MNSLQKPVHSGTTPVVDGNYVTFSCLAPAATMVNVLGTFNHWSLTNGVMERDAAGFWTKTVSVPLEGSYDYKFVIDGQWVLDDRNPDYGKDHRDRYNSRFLVGTSELAEKELAEIDRGLAANPAGSNSLARPALFTRLDRILQLPTAPHSHEIRDHFSHRIMRLLRPGKSKGESYIASVYCHGNILARGGVKIGMDIVTTRSVWGVYWDVPEVLISGMANFLDVLCVSHLHPDHLDPRLIGKMLEMEKPVFVPSEAIDRFPPGAIGVGPDQTVNHQGWQIKFHKGAHVYDERKMLILRYFEIVSPDGFRLLHTTDHDYTTGLNHGDGIDLLIAKGGGVSPFVNDMVAFENLLLHVRPRRFLSGHLNELGHAVRGGREPYSTGWEIIRQNPGISADVLHWGAKWNLD